MIMYTPDIDGSVLFVVCGPANEWLPRCVVVVSAMFPLLLMTNTCSRVSLSTYEGSGLQL